MTMERVDKKMERVDKNTERVDKKAARNETTGQQNEKTIIKSGHYPYPRWLPGTLCFGPVFSVWCRI